MKCVIDTSAMSWMERIGRLKLLTNVYETIYAPPQVFLESATHEPIRDFVTTYITPIALQGERAKEFHKYVRRWKRKIELDDIADIQVFVGYKFFTDADEALYANKHAEQKFSPFGNVRDIARLYEPAERKRIFTRQDSIGFLESLLNTHPPYRPKYVRKLIADLQRR